MADRPVVVDASAGIALVRRELHSPLVAAQFGAWHTSGVRLVVPALFWLEIANALLRRHGRRGKDVIAAIHALDDLGFETVDLDRAQLLLALDHAERFALTVYDAAYLALAESLDASLFTSDSALIAAAGTRAIEASDPAHRLSEPPARYGHPTWPDYREVSAYLARLRSEAQARRSPATSNRGE